MSTISAKKSGFQAPLFQMNQKFPSIHLKRELIFDVVLPPDYKPELRYKILLMNDGQDFGQLKMDEILTRFWKEKKKDFVFVGLHCNENRLQEYGTANITDYKKRGSKAGEYNDFVINEMMPFLVKRYNLSQFSADHYFCGFSLGGLSAIDIVWANARTFSKVGVFSGSFWWRKKAYDSGYKEDKDRIMHKKIANGKFNPGQQFWFECGTHDETSDRNGNGIIDSIDDTLDLIKELELKGYKKHRDIHYLEIEKGEHNFGTWKKAMPEFLNWAFSD